MEVISEEALEIKGDSIGLGAFSIVREAKIGDKIYAYKRFHHGIPNHMISHLAELTERTFDEEFLTPIFLVQSSNLKGYTGYLTLYDNFLKEPIKIGDYEHMIEFISKAKETLLKLHHKYKIIHGDIHGGNMLFNPHDYRAYFIDFDNMLESENNFKGYRAFSNEAGYYLQYHKRDYNLDIYMFNLTTLALLTDYGNRDVLRLIEEDNLSISSENEKVKVLSKELLLTNTKKNYSGEFIIDYL